jgi:rod shape-determining protein MreC
MVLVVLLLVAVSLVALSGRGGNGPLATVQHTAGAVFGPVQRAAANAFRPVRSFFSGLSSDDQARLEQLQKENDALRLAAEAQAYTQARAAQLDSLLKIAGLGQYRVVPAQVIAVGPLQGFSWTVEIDAGSIDGLKVGMTVINGDGLVGRVTLVNGTTATVLLAIDPKFVAGARVAGSQAIGWVTGNGLGPMKVQLPDTSVVLAPGQRLVTGAVPDDAFAPGIPIGTIVSAQNLPGSLGRVAQLKPFVDFTNLDIIGIVIKGPRTNPRDSVLPPKPTPSASASASTSAGAAAGATTSGSPSPTTSGH